LSYIVEKLQKKLGKQEIIYISKVLPIEGNNTELKALEALDEHTSEVHNQVILGVPIEHGYFINLKNAKSQKELVTA
jgi:hypothetical protein